MHIKYIFYRKNFTYFIKYMLRNRNIQLLLYIYFINKYQKTVLKDYL